MRDEDDALPTQTLVLDDAKITTRNGLQNKGCKCAQRLTLPYESDPDP